MSRLVSAAFLTAVLSGSKLVAQAPVPVYREPHHRLVLEAGPVRVIDVDIQPGDTTQFHIHDSPILLVRVAISPVDIQNLGAEWGGAGARKLSNSHPGAIDLDTSYALRPITHRIANIGRTSFRLIGVINGGPGQSTEDRLNRVTLPGTAASSSSWFQASRLALPPATATPWFTAPATVIVVQPVDGTVRVEREGGRTALLDRPASWTYLPAGTRYRVRNDGDAGGSLVFVAPL